MESGGFEVFREASRFRSCYSFLFIFQFITIEFSGTERLSKRYLTENSVQMLYRSVDTQ
jgi:hypothetical protein